MMKMKWIKSHKYLSAAWALAVGVAALNVGGEAWAQGSAVAMVIAIKGAPQLKGAPGKLRLGSRLLSGQIVRCAPGSEATVVVFGSGKRFRIASGHEVKVAPDMKGANLLPAQSGVSREVARALAGSRTGAVNMRGISDEAANARAFGTFTLLDASADAASPSRPELGFLTEGVRILAWPGDLPSNQSETLAPSGYVLWTLFDSSSNIVHHARIDPQSGGQVRAEIPADVELVTRRCYTWRAVSYALEPSGARRALGSRWGLVTWLPAPEATNLSTLVPVGISAAKLARTNPEQAFLLASLLRSRKVDGAAWSLLSALRNANVAGAESAYFDFYGSLPAISQLFGAQIPSYLRWKSQN